MELILRDSSWCDRTAAAFAGAASEPAPAASSSGTAAPPSRPPSTLVEPGKPAAAAQTMSMAEAAEQKRPLASQSEAFQDVMYQIEHQRAAEATQAKAKAQAAEELLEQ